ncbi:MAG TPA: hypothetical protein VGG01_05230 [Xanthobacteraceae bacterium]|jgi:hypothetical protein
MYAFCLVLSAIATALGFLALGFGIPIHDFNLGNTLIISGAVAIVGGMVMFGLATAVRQLGRIADALGPRAAMAPRRAAAAAEVVDGPPPPGAAPAQRQSAGGRVAYPPRPGADQRGPGAPPPPPLPEMPEAPPPMERPVERPRINMFGAGRVPGEAPMTEEEVPLAPSRAPGSQMGRGVPPPPAEPPPSETPRQPEPRPTQADIMARLSNLAAAPPRQVQRPEPPRAPPPPPPPPPVERATPADPRRPNMFDALWPAEVRAARQSQPETIARAPRPDARPEARLDAKPEPRPDMRSEPRSETRPEPRFEPPAPPRERNDLAANGSAREPMMPPSGEQRPIAILKSGVIDGMAYTLYTDGSIEAELPQGTMRFASIDDLRAHLEKTDRP